MWTILGAIAGAIWKTFRAIGRMIRAFLDAIGDLILDIAKLMLCLVVFGVFLFGLGSFLSAETILQEIAGLLMVLIAVVVILGALIIINLKSIAETLEGKKSDAAD